MSSALGSKPRRDQNGPSDRSSAGGHRRTVPRQTLRSAPAVPERPAPPYEGGRAAARRAARRKRAEARPDPLRQLLPQALVVAFLAGGTCAFLTGDKKVELSVDGTPRTLHTFAGDVQQLLDEQHIPVGAHDTVAPGPDTGLRDGDEVAVGHGRPIALTLDGQRYRVWTTARTVDEALHRLGMRAQGAHLSLPRETPIARHGLALDVRTERTVTFLADGRERTLRTTAATVREAIEQAGIRLGHLDAASAALDSFPRDGQIVSVLRISGSRRVRDEPLPYRTVRRDDPTLSRGTEVVVRKGRPGVQQVTYEQRTVNGARQRPRRIGARTVRRPVDEIVAVGTRPLPRSVEGADDLDWHGLAECEAGGRPYAVDPSGTYGGLYQFDDRTWHELGGSGRPQDASRAEQTYRAKKLYVRRGATPWPVCGRTLYR